MSADGVLPEVSPGRRGGLSPVLGDGAAVPPVDGWVSTAGDRPLVVGDVDVVDEVEVAGGVAVDADVEVDGVAAVDGDGAVEGETPVDAEGTVDGETPVDETPVEAETDVIGETDGAAVEDASDVPTEGLVVGGAVVTGEALADTEPVVTGGVTGAGELTATAGLLPELTPAWTVPPPLCAVIKPPPAAGPVDTDADPDTGSAVTVPARLTSEPPVCVGPA